MLSPSEKRTVWIFCIAAAFYASMWLIFGTPDNEYRTKMLGEKARILDNPAPNYYRFEVGELPDNLIGKQYLTRIEIVHGNIVILHLIAGQDSATIANALKGL